MATLLCSGFGQYHTNHPDKPAAKRQPYSGVTIQDIFNMAENPANVPKPKAQWCIPHNDTGPYGRDKAHLMTAKDVLWVLLWADIDGGKHSLEAIIAALVAIFGNVELCVYSSKSATPDNPKWRIVITLVVPVDGGTFEQCQSIFNDLLTEQGIEPDRKSESANQVFYLPNRGNYYKYFVNKDAPLLGVEFFTPHLERIEAERQAAQQTQQQRMEAFKQRKHESGERDDAYLHAAVLGKLNDAARRLAATGDGEKHKALLKEAALWGGLLHFGYFSEAEAVDVLVGTIAERCKSVANARKTAQEALKAGADKPISADEILSGRKEQRAKDDLTEKGPGKLPPQSKLALALHHKLPDLAFDDVREDWAEYRDNHWQYITKRAASKIINQAVSDAVGEVGYSSGYLSGVAGLVEMHKSSSEWNIRHGGIPFQNGVLRLTDRKLIPHKREHFLTWQIPIDYQPNASAPNFQAWLLECVGGQDDQVQLLRAFVHCILTGRADLQRYLELIGPGGTGKSTFIRVCELLI